MQIQIYNIYHKIFIKYTKIIIKLNYNGLCLINIKTFDVVKDTILKLNDKPFGLEDVRLFIENDKVYLTGAGTVGFSDKNEEAWNDNRILKQLICEIGNINDLKNNLPNNMIDIIFNCIESQTNNIEKNWFGYVDNGSNILINPTYPTFFPLNKYKIN